MLDELVEFYPISQVPQPIVRNMFGCSLYPSLGNQGLLFSPSVGEEIQLVEQANPSLNIALPGSLSGAVGQDAGLAFCAYREESLFIRRETYLIQSGRNSLVVASNVVSARLSLGLKVSNLVEPVRMSFTRKDVCDHSTLQCIRSV